MTEVGSAPARDRWRFVPMAGWIRSYERRWLKGDLIAGVAVAALIVPKNLGYAGIAGIPLQNGLYAAAAGAILYAVFGTSRQISTGPSSGLAAVAASAVAVAGITGVQDVASFVAMITLVSGVLFLLLAVLKMGWIAQFLSRAVVTGFLFGAAIDVVIGELPKLTGTKVDRLEPAPGAVVLARDTRRCPGADRGRRRGRAGGGVRAAGDRATHPRGPRPGGRRSAGVMALRSGRARGGPGRRGATRAADPAGPRRSAAAGPRRARSPWRRWRWCSSGSRRPPVTPGRSRPSTTTASTSTRNRSPRAWRTSAPACSRECRSRPACPRAR